jgi:N-acetylmuramoyl-L-alanine amidase
MRRFLFILLFLVPAISSAQLEGLVIVIDPGHGGHNPANDRHLIPDPGVDFWESESNFQKALLLKSLLEFKGATLHLTRMTNDYPDDLMEPSLQTRVSFANTQGADWFHSIHSNAFNAATNYTLLLVRELIVAGGDSINGPGAGSGIPMWPQAWEMSALMGPNIQQYLRTTSWSRRTDYSFYGTYTLGVLRGLWMPGELSEGSFHDFSPETRRLMNNDYRKMEAHGLMKAFLQYFGAPADTFGIIAGIQTNPETGKPMNGTVVRILPENQTYTGDAFNNGFYMFDSLTTGPHEVVFDTPGFLNDTAEIMVGTGGIHFVDRVLAYGFTSIIQTAPADGDTSIAVNAPVAIRFSLPMDTASVRQAFSVSPAADASFSWTPDLKWLTVTFDPALEYYTPYTILIDSAAKGVNGFGVDLDGDEIGGDTLAIAFRTESALQAAAPASFGQVKKDDTANIMLVIRNRASYAIVLESISNSTSQFWTTSSLPDTIAAADSTSIGVYFSPASFGSFSDVIILSSDSGTIAVPASGSSLAPNLLPSHTLLGFSSVMMDTSKNRPFYLRTTSVNEVRVDSIYTKTAAFSYSPQLSFPQNLTMADTIFLTIEFTPQGLGTATDSLIILSSAPNVIRVYLTGIGIVNSVEKVGEAVDRFALLQNYPNPFNPETTIEFHVPETSPVHLEIVDIMGRTVRTLASSRFSPGAYRIVWDATDGSGSRLSSGVYFYRLVAGENVFLKKMLLLK